MSLEERIRELTDTMKEFIRVMNQTPAQIEPPSVVHVDASPEKKKKKAKKKKKKEDTAAADNLLAEAAGAERQEVLPAVDTEVTATMDEMLAEARKNVNLLQDDTFARSILSDHGYEGFKEVAELDVTSIYNALKARNDE